MPASVRLSLTGAGLLGLVLLGSCHLSEGTSDAAQPVTAQASGTAEMVQAGGQLFISSRFSGEVLALDPQRGQVRFRQALAGDIQHPPGALAVNSDRLAVLQPTRGTLTLLDRDTGQNPTTVAVGQRPRGVAATRGYFWVTDPDTRTLRQLDSRGQPVKTYHLEYPPGPLATAPPNRLAVSALRGDQWTLFELQNGRAVKVQTGQWSKTAQQAETLWLDGQTLWTAMQVADTGSADRRAEAERAIRPFLLRASLDTPGTTGRQALDLSANILSRPIALLPVAHASTGEPGVWILGANSNEIRRASLSWAGIPRRLGQHPRALVADTQRNRLWVWDALDFTLIEFDPVDEQIAHRFPHPPKDQMPDAEWLAGAGWFHNARHTATSRGWMACDTCHLDGGQDHLTWYLGDGPRNTPFLGGSLDLLPLHWSGDRDELQDFEQTLIHLQGGTGFLGDEHGLYADMTQIQTAGRSDELDALARYIGSLPKPAGERVPGAPEPSITRGRELFLFEASSTQCTHCHQGNGEPVLDANGNALARQDVGTRSDDRTPDGRYDIPSLRGLAFSAPYLHDGSAPDLETVLTTANPNDEHGITSHLKEKEIADLISFLRTL